MVNPLSNPIGAIEYAGRGRTNRVSHPLTSGEDGHFGEITGAGLATIMGTS